METQYLAAQNMVEPRLHLIADQSTLKMYCGKQLTGYWYGKVAASKIGTDVHGICEECKKALLKSDGLIKDGK